MGEQPNGARRQLIGLQYLRAIAALSVVLFHAVRIKEGPWLILAYGVDLFFILSGFIMVAITDESSRPWPFLKDRILRIVPLYWILTIAYVLMSLWKGLPLTVSHTLASLFFLSWPHPLDGKLMPVIAAGWTLSYEMFFYAVFAALLPLPRKWLVPALTLALVAFAAIHPVVRAIFIAWRGWPHLIFLEFVSGAWLGWAWQRGKLLPTAAAVWIATSAFAIGGAIWVEPMMIAQLALIPILVGTLIIERIGRMPDWRVLRFLGDASYSIYLFHIFAMVAGNYFGRRYGIPFPVLVTAKFVSGVIGGCLVYWYLERPMLAWLRRGRVRRGIVVPSGP